MKRYLKDHLQAATDYADTYYCSISKNNKNCYMDTVADRIKSWVEKNGGSFKVLSDKKFIGYRKGYLVKITFPAYNTNKQLMAEL